jgi:gas vesicle protein
MARRDDYYNKDNSFQSGVLGLALGLVAGAALVILSDPEKREKAKEKATELLDKTKDSTLTTVNKLADTVKAKTENIQSAVEKVVAQADDAVSKEINKIESKEDEEEI